MRRVNQYQVRGLSACFIPGAVAAAIEQSWLGLLSKSYRVGNCNTDLL